MPSGIREAIIELISGMISMRDIWTGQINQAVDKKTREVAERMIRDGALPDEKIAQYSGFTVEQVQKIRSDMLVTA